MFGKKNFLSNRRYPSATEALRKIIGARLLSAAILEAPDRRNLLKQAAKLKGMSENDLIRQVADCLDMPLFFKPSCSHVESLPVGVNLSDLRIAAVLPITAKGIIIGVVCADPEVLNSMPHLYTGSNVYLCSWDAIREALDESEGRYRERIIKEMSHKKENEALIYKKILGSLMQQAERGGTNRLLLYLDRDNLRYYYEDRLGQRWSGDVDSQVSAGLSAYLENLIADSISQPEVIGENEESICVNLSLEHGNFIVTSDSNQSAGLNLRSLPILVKRQDKIGSALVSGHIENIEVLIVDDNAVFAEVLKKFLLKRGIASSYCPNVHSALAFLMSDKTTRPDLIICDLHMPHLNGIDLLKAVKQNPLLSGIAVLILTSDDDPKTELLVLEMGVDAFVLKTKDPAILHAHVKRLVEREQAA